MTQEEALQIMKMGTNVFLTGAPGAGKTHVLNKYLDFLYECGVNVAITASTGIAATHIGGTTIHSWSGIGVKKYIPEEEIDRMTQNERLYKRYRDTRVLVIDEVSMLSAGQLEMVDMIARKMRRNNESFGGMQVILAGDFFQLPPVVRPGDDDRYAFESPSFREMNPAICYLEESHRHKDETLKGILLGIRRQNISDTLYRYLEERIKALESGEKTPDETTRLYTHNVDVDSLNESRLKKIDGRELTFEMVTRGGKAAAKTLKSWCLAPETLCLKEGAQVMFVKNDPAGRFVNGTRGTVAGVEGGLPVVKMLSGREITADYMSWVVEENGKVKAEISQIPLRLAWAITVHKSQGMTMDEAHIDLSKAFTPGQGYVALSRLKSIEGLYLSGLNEKALLVDERALASEEEFLSRSRAAVRRLEEIGEREVEKRIKDFVKNSGGKMPAGGADSQGEGRGAKRRAEKDTPRRTPKASTYEKTHQLAEKELSVEKIARERGVKKATIISHLEKLKAAGSGPDLSYMLPELRRKVADFGKIQLAFSHLKKFKLTPVKKYLEKKGAEVGFDDIRLARLMLPDREFKKLKRNSEEK